MAALGKARSRHPPFHPSAYPPVPRPLYEPGPALRAVTANARLARSTALLLRLTGRTPVGPSPLPCPAVPTTFSPIFRSAPRLRRGPSRPTSTCQAATTNYVTPFFSLPRLSFSLCCVPGSCDVKRNISRVLIQAMPTNSCISVGDPPGPSVSLALDDDPRP